MLKRRLFLATLGLTLAAPPIVRRSGVLMPVRAPRPRPFRTFTESTPTGFDDLREQWEGNYLPLASQWRGMWTGAPGNVGMTPGGGFDFSDGNMELAIDRMRRMREQEAWLAEQARTLVA